ASSASVHSTRMLPKFFMILPWVPALNEVNTAPFGVCDRKDSALFTERVQRAACADVDASVSNRRCRVTLVVEFVDGEHFPLARCLHDRHLTALPDQVNLVIGSNG